MLDSIENEYLKMRSNAEHVWSQATTLGKHIGLPDGYYKIGVSIGSYYKPNQLLERLLGDLSKSSSGNPDIVTIPKNCNHFTFLALAGHHWSQVCELPSEIKGLKKVCDDHFQGSTWGLSNLQLVPGRNFLLLCGMPDIELVKSRKKFSEKLLDSPLKSHIRERHEYKEYAFPPKIWHTTICRSKKDLKNDKYIKKI